MFASLRSPIAAFLLLPALAVQTAATPSYRSLYSGCFGPDEQGRIFAAVSALEALPGLVSPLAIMFLYSQTVTHGYAGMAFYALAAAALAAALALCYVRTGPEDRIRATSSNLVEAPSHCVHLVAEDQNPLQRRSDEENHVCAQFGDGGNAMVSGPR